MLHTPLTTQWHLKYPIVSAPMAGVAYGRLARAVTLAGGLGFIGMGSSALVSTIEKESAIARGSDNARFGIGLMIWAIQRRPELLDVSIAAKPYIISISFGDPAPYVDRLHREGILVATQVNSREHTRRALNAGVDLIVAQGTEAGGHTSQVATLPLLQIVLDTVGGRCPVLAAGGIGSARGLAAVLAAGADGVWIGTALLASQESAVTDPARQRILSATESDTTLTRAYDVAQKIPWPAEHPGRALRNTFTDRWTDHEAELPQHPEAIAAYEDAVKRNDYTLAHIYAGQAVGMVGESRPAADILRDLADGAEQLLRSRVRQLLE
ncbi:MAG: NAD(P)H-dependent flavin oxidoreductase [Bacillota bacterium]